MKASSRMSRWTKAVLALGVALALVSGCGDAPAVKKQKAVARGEQYLKENKPNEAVIELKNALEIDPNFVPALHALGRAYAAKSWYGDALRELERALQVAPDTTPIMVTIGRILLDAGAYADAEARANKILVREPGNAEALGIQALALLGEGKSKEALAVLENTPAGTIAEADLIRAGALLQQGKTGEAERALQTVLDQKPDDFRSLLGMGDIKIRKRDYEQALKLYERAQTLRPLDPRPRLGIAAVKAQKGQAAEAIKEVEAIDPQARSVGVALVLANYYLAGNRAADAERLLLPILERFPKLAAGRLLLGSAYMIREKPELAAVQFEELVRQYPDEPVTHFRLATAYARLGLGKEALAELDRVANVMDRTAVYHLERARTLLVLRRVNEALQEARRAEQLAPGRPQTFLLLGQIYMQRGDAKTARELFSKAAEVGGGEAAGHLALGRLAQFEKNPNVALQQFEAAVNADPTSVWAARAKVSALIRQNRVKDAIQFAEGAAQRAPNQAEFQMLLGAVYSADQQWEKTAGAYRKAMELDRTGVGPRLGLARVALAQGKDEEAIVQLQSALQQERANPAAVLILAGLYESLSRYDQAIAVMEAAERAAPRRVEFSLRLGELYLKKGRYDDAEAKARELLAAHPDLGAAHVIRGQALLAKGDSRALKDFTDIVKENPNSAQAQALLARAYVRLGRNADAQAAYREAIKLDPQFVPAKTELALTSGQKTNRAELQGYVEQLRAFIKASPKNLLARETLSRYLLFLGETKEAKEQLKAILDVAPGHPAANLLMAGLAMSEGKRDEAAKYARWVLRSKPSDIDANVFMAQYLLQANRRDEAAKHLETALQVNPTLLGVKLQLAAIYAGQDRFDDAMRLAREVQKTEPKNPGLPIVMGMVLVGQKKPQEAIEAFNQALAVKSDLGDAHRGLGQAYEQLNQTDKAVAAYQRAIAINGNDAASLNNLAWILSEARKSPDEALPLVTRAEQLAPDAPEVLDTLGWVRYRLGAFAEAEKALRKAAERAPNNGAIQFHLGMAYARTGKRSEAVSALRQAAKLDPKLRETERLDALVRQLEAGG